jgi:polynucleotide 5'-kinase involved in rRNA processing
MNMVVKAEKSAIHAISLFGTQPEIEEDEVPVGIALRPDASPRAAGLAPSNLVDLTGKPKVWLTIGRGKTGKTTLIRFLVEETIGAGRQVVIADVDRTNATLANYFVGVQRPPATRAASLRGWNGY